MNIFCDKFQKNIFSQSVFKPTTAFVCYFIQKISYYFSADFLPKIALSQENDEFKRDNIIEQRIETIAENLEDSETDYTDLLEEMLYFKQNRLDLNRASSEDLRNLNLLSDVQIVNLLDHIRKTGKLIAIYELQAIKGFDLETIARILPFVKVVDTFDDAHFSLSQMLKYGSHKIVARYSRVLEQQRGFLPISDSALAANPNSRFLGSPHGIFTRYRFTYSNRVSISLTGEKDPGEEFFRGSQRQGFDFYSGHFALRNFGKVKTLVVGDYLAQFGQGVTLWLGQGFGKSADPMLIKRNPRGIVPSNSLNELLFMRGAASTVRIKNMEYSAFFSRKAIDANVSRIDTVDNTIEEVTSFLLSGFHRTPNEVARKGTVTETMAGGNVSYKTRALSIGFTGVSTQYSALLNRNLRLYNQFEFSSNENLNMGVDYNAVVRNVNVFGEVSRSMNGGGWAWCMAP
jgi:hypothetical protein